MTFDKILEDGRLWAVRYEEGKSNCFEMLFSNWYDMSWLKSFFEQNILDLASFFHITDVYEAVMETFDEARKHLENGRYSEMSLGREKAYGDGSYRHPSWLRIYAIKIEPDVYLVTGGAIKLTHQMKDRPHTLAELAKMERVRNYLLDNGVFDIDGIKDLANEQSN